MATEFHAVSIKFKSDGCAAIKALDGQRFLSREAVLPPVSDCDNPNCRCTFHHHDDRRAVSRRDSDDGLPDKNRETKLFEQLAVKDKQISAWDELTQGLTRGLATGQLVPSLLSGPPESVPERSAATATDSPSQPVQDGTVVKDSSPATWKKSSRKKRSKSKPKQKRSKTVFEKHTPTFHKLASRLIRRS